MNKQCPQCGEFRLKGSESECSVCLTEYHCPDCGSWLYIKNLLSHLDEHRWMFRDALEHVRAIYEEAA